MTRADGMSFIRYRNAIPFCTTTRLCVLLSKYQAPSPLKREVDHGGLKQESSNKKKPTTIPRCEPQGFSRPGRSLWRKQAAPVVPVSFQSHPVERPEKGHPRRAAPRQLPSPS